MGKLNHQLFEIWVSCRFFNKRDLWKSMHRQTKCWKLSWSTDGDDPQTFCQENMLIRVWRNESKSCKIWLNTSVVTHCLFLRRIFWYSTKEPYIPQKRPKFWWAFKAPLEGMWWLLIHILRKRKAKDANVIPRTRIHVGLSYIDAQWRVLNYLLK